MRERCWAARVSQGLSVLLRRFPIMYRRITPVTSEMENSSLRLQVPPLAGAVLQDHVYGSGWAFLRPEDVTGAHDPYGQVAGDLVRCALVERHLDLLVLGPLSDLLVLVLRLVRTRLGHAAAHSLQDEEEEQPQAAAQDRVRGELVLGRATLEHALYVRQAAPQVEAREEEAEHLEAVDAGAGLLKKIMKRKGIAAKVCTNCSGSRE